MLILILISFLMIYSIFDFIVFDVFHILWNFSFFGFLDFGFWGSFTRTRTHPFSSIRAPHAHAHTPLGVGGCGGAMSMKGVRFKVHDSGVRFKARHRDGTT